MKIEFISDLNFNCRFESFVQCPNHYWRELVNHRVHLITNRLTFHLCPTDAKQWWESKRKKMILPSNSLVHELWKEMFEIYPVMLLYKVRHEFSMLVHWIPSEMPHSLYHQIDNICKKKNSSRSSRGMSGLPGHFQTDNTCNTWT